MVSFANFVRGEKVSRASPSPSPVGVDEKDNYDDRVDRKTDFGAEVVDLVEVNDAIVNPGELTFEEGKPPNRLCYLLTLSRGPI